MLTKRRSFLTGLAALRQSLEVFAVVSSPDWMKRTIIKLAILIFKTFRKSYTYTHYVKKNILYSSIRGLHSFIYHYHELLSTETLFPRWCGSLKNILNKVYFLCLSYRERVQNDCYQGGQVDASDSPDQPCRLKSTEMNKKIYVL